MLAESTVVIISVCVNQNILLYTLHLYNDVCQLFLNKTDEGEP